MTSEGQGSEAPHEAAGQAYKNVERVQLLYRDQLMLKANVIGVGIGRGKTLPSGAQEISLVVMVSKKIPRALLDARDILPGEIEGVPVQVQEVGDIQPMNFHSSIEN